MNDFIKIGGEIVSAPLNENFRKLRNDISRSNTNLVFSDKYGIQNNIQDMMALLNNPEVNLTDGQACYVIASGELYRYSGRDNNWHKIADFGQTFRQALLNSGVVAIQKNSDGSNGAITKKDNTTLTIPSSLVYFKTLPGDDRYLKGMYLIQEQDLDISDYISSAGAYSIYLMSDSVAEGIETSNYYTIGTGMPQSDNSARIYMGGFLADGNGHIIDNFIYTIPDIAYTADRGFFYLTGGQVKGCSLEGNGTGDEKVAGRSGMYYDEGINAPQEDLEDFSIESYSGSNYNLRNVNAEQPLNKLFYLYPVNSLTNPITSKVNKIDYSHYYNESTDSLETVGKGQFTIQRHLLTPCGSDCTDIILYGKKLYNSLDDALSNINTPDVLDLGFPYVEVTRIVVGNPVTGVAFSTDNPELCNFNTLERLGQIGTYEPKFADDKFMIYSGQLSDPNPSHFKFSLNELQRTNYDGNYYLYLLPHEVTRYDFGLSKKYIKDGDTPSVTMSHVGYRNVTDGNVSYPGYEITDATDLANLRTRVNDIESEIWHIYDSSKSNIYEQSIRYRLFHLESDVANLSKTRVHKNTKINGYKLGDDLTNENEAKNFSLKTGDIAEGAGLGSGSNLWYTEARVNANSHVSAAYTHSTKKGSGTVKDKNPHGLSFDDISDGVNYHGLSTAQRTAISNLPSNISSSLADLGSRLSTAENNITSLNTNKIDSISIKKLGGNHKEPTGTETALGNVKTLRFYDEGINIDISGNMATIDCMGQMSRDVYAKLSKEYPETYAGVVDIAAEANMASMANQITSVLDAGTNKYYGTNGEGLPGTYNLPVYITTADATSYASIDQVTFVPIDKSVKLAHLGDSSVTYSPTDEETILGTNLHDLVVNHYHKALDSATLKSSEINEWNFGNNLSVSINGHRATINATGGSGTGVSKFANLDDVNVTYTGNAGKTFVVNNDETGVVLSDMPSLSNYMLKSTYVDALHPNYVKLAMRATNADNANSANTATTALSLQEVYGVNDGGTTDTDLWSADKIIEYTATQVNTGVKTYSGTNIPSSSLGKNGDLYILLED